MTFHFPFVRPLKAARTAISPSLSAAGLPASKGSGRLSSLLVLAALVVAFSLTGCTPNLGGDNVGWAPLSVQFSDVPGSPVRVYVVSELDGNLDDLGERLGKNLKEDEKQVKLHALEDFGSGAPRVVWTYPALGSGGGLVGAFGTPAVSEELGLVFISAVDGYLYAVAAENGSEAAGWKRAVRDDPGQPPLPVISSPTLARLVNTDTGPMTVVVVGSEDGSLYAYNATTGDELPWSPFKTQGKIWSTPAVSNGIAYFGSQDHHVYAVDLRDGQQLWRYQTGGAIVSDPLLFNGKVFIGSFDKKLYALDADDGEQEWAFQSDNWFWAGPVTDGSTVFAPSMDGRVYALNPNKPASEETKRAHWQHDMESPVVATPALVPLGLVVAAVDGSIRLLSANPANLEMGEIVSNLPSREKSSIKSPIVGGSPLPAADVNSAVGSLSVIRRHSAYVSGDDGAVRRIEVTEGRDKEVIWCFDTRKLEPCN